MIFSLGKSYLEILGEKMQKCWQDFLKTKLFSHPIYQFIAAAPPSDFSSRESRGRQ